VVREKGAPKLENFFSQAEGNNQQVELVQDISSDEENALPSENIVLSLEKDLKENFTTMSANEYVWKRAIFEYSVRLIKGEGKYGSSEDSI